MRLVLRAPIETDFSAYGQLMASPRSKGMGGPFDTRTAWGMFCHDVASWSLFGHGALMADLRATGECVGQVGINHGPLFPEKELGWLVYEANEGLGYASEAAVALRDWAGRTLGLAGLVSYIDPENRASIKVAERLGAILDPQAPGRMQATSFIATSRWSDPGRPRVETRQPLLVAIGPGLGHHPRPTRLARRARRGDAGTNARDDGTTAEPVRSRRQVQGGPS